MPGNTLIASTRTVVSTNTPTEAAPAAPNSAAGAVHAGGARRIICQGGRVAVVSCPDGAIPKLQTAHAAQRKRLAGRAPPQDGRAAARRHIRGLPRGPGVRPPVWRRRLGRVPAVRGLRARVRRRRQMSPPGWAEPLAAVADRLARLVRDRAYLAFRAHLESDALPFGEDDWAEYDRYVALLEAFYTRVDEIPELDADPWQTRAEIGATANAHLRALDAAAAAKRALPGEPAEDPPAAEAAALAGSVAEYMAGREHAAAAAQLRRREDLPGLRAHPPPRRR